MGKKKKKIPKLTEAQYVAYITSLRDDAALYNTNGEEFVPKTLRKEEEKKDY